MKKNLTTTMKSDVFKKAKEYARENGVSLSSLVEHYLDTLANDEKRGIDISPLVKSISGVVDLPEDYDFKEDYTEYLMKKYR